MNEDIFVGRKEELQMIDEMVFDPTGNNHLLWIVGDGGIGKTWLLRQVNHRYEKNPHVVLLNIDYGQTWAQSLPTLALELVNQIARYLPQDYQDEFRSRLGNLHRVKPEFDVTVQEDEVYRFGVELAKYVSTNLHKRILILSDTTEASKSVSLGKRINALISELPNAVIVLAGRPYDEMLSEFDTFPNIFDDKWIIHDLYELKPLPYDETSEYIGKIVPDTDSNLRLKIHILAGGNPVLLAIAGEWLKRHIELPSQIDLSVEQLQGMVDADLAIHRKRFEFELIERVRRLSEPIDWAVLYMAYLNRRYDPKILELLLHITSRQESQDIIAQLQTLVFVRKSMFAEGGLLHDEAQRLINEYAWPIVDPDGAMRRNLAQQVIQGYYLPEIKQLQEEIRALVVLASEQSAAAPGQPVVPPIPSEELLKQTLQIECLDYQLRIDVESGFVYLDQLLEEAQRTRSHIFIEALTEAIYNLAPEQDTVAFQTRAAEVFLTRKEEERAVTLAQEALKEPDIQPFEAARALNVLGQATGEIAEKERYFKGALEKARLGNATDLQATVLQNLGLLYRRTGRWADAEKSYQQALHLLVSDSTGEWYANIMNNLAYVLMLRGQLDRADTLAERALRIRRDLGSRPGLAFSHFTKGRIADAKGDYASALREYQTALGWFKSIADEENIAWVQVDMAQAERRADRFEEAKTLLLPALLDNARPDIRLEALSQAAKVAIDEAEAASRRGAAQEDVQTTYTQAHDYANQAMKAAVALGDVHLQAIALFDLILMTFLSERCADTERIAELQSLLEDHDFPLEKAHLIELHGSLAYAHDDFSEAFEHYLEACRILADYSIGRFRRVFERVRAKFMDAPLEVQVQVCKLWTPALQGISPQSPLQALQALCLDDFGM